MATKSKTQRAKASEKRQAKKAVKAEESQVVESSDQTASKPEKKGLLSKAEAPKSSDAKPAKVEAKPKKTRFKFLKEVRSELKRVTWPTRVDVMRWTGVVIVALLFFGIYVAILDNAIVTPLLVALSGLGA